MGVAWEVSERAGVRFDTLSILFVSSHCTGQCVMQPMLFRKGWTKCCITKLPMSWCKCTDPACHGKFVTSVWMPKSGKSCPQHGGHVLLCGWLLASELVEAQCCFWEPSGAAGSPHPQMPVTMSVVAGVDQHAGYSHLGAVFSTEALWLKCTKQEGMIWLLLCWMWCNYTGDSNV